MNDVLAPTHSEVQLGDAARAILEARAEPRVGVDFPVQVFSGDFSGPLSARARDISVDGVCVATTSMLSFNAIRRLRLDLASGPLELNAEGRWQTDATSDDSTLTGVKFTDPDKGAVSQLWSVVNDARKELGLFLFERSDLSDLSADDVTSLADCSRYRLVAARRRIYQQDECQPGDDSIFVVLRGEASLRVRLGKRRETILERLTPGSLFGGLPAVADLPNQESAVADSQVTLLEISRTSCTYLHFARPLLAQRLARIITRAQLRRSHRSVELASLSA
jgi:hypothetical protein